MSTDHPETAASVAIVALGYRVPCTEAGCKNLSRLLLRYADTGGRPMSNSEFCHGHGRLRVARDRTAGLRQRVLGVTILQRNRSNWRVYGLCGLTKCIGERIIDGCVGESLGFSPSPVWTVDFCDFGNGAEIRRFDGFGTGSTQRVQEVFPGRWNCQAGSAKPTPSDPSSCTDLPDEEGTETACRVAQEISATGDKLDSAGGD